MFIQTTLVFIIITIILLSYAVLIRKKETFNNFDFSYLNPEEDAKLALNETPGMIPIDTCGVPEPCHIENITDKHENNPYTSYLMSSVVQDPNFKDSNFCIEEKACVITNDDKKALHIPSCEQVGMKTQSNGDCKLSFDNVDDAQGSTQLATTLDRMKYYDNLEQDTELRKMQQELSKLIQQFNINRRSIQSLDNNIRRTTQANNNIQTELRTVLSTKAVYDSANNVLGPQVTKSQFALGPNQSIERTMFATLPMRCGTAKHTGVQIIQKLFNNRSTNIGSNGNGYYNLLFKYARDSNISQASDPYTLWMSASDFFLNVSRLEAEMLSPTTVYRNRFLINEVFTTSKSEQYYIVVEIYNNNMLLSTMMFLKTSPSLTSWFNRSNYINNNKAPNISSANFSLEGNGHNRWVISTRDISNCESNDIFLCIPVGSSCLSEHRRSILVAKDSAFKKSTLSQNGAIGNIMYVYAKKVNDDPYQDEANLNKMCR